MKTHQQQSFKNKGVFNNIILQRSQLRRRTRKCLSDLAAKPFLAFSRIGSVEQGQRSQTAMSREIDRK